MSKIERPKFRKAILLLVASLTIAGVGDKNQVFINKLFDKLRTQGVNGLVTDINRDFDSLFPKSHNQYSLELLESDLSNSLLSRLKNVKILGLKEEGIESYVNGVLEQYQATLAVVDITKSMKIISSTSLRENSSEIILPPSQFNTDGSFMMYTTVQTDQSEVPLSQMTFIPNKRGGIGLIGENFIVLNSSELATLIKTGQPNFAQEFAYTISSTEGGTSVLNGEFVTSGANVNNMKSFKYAFCTYHFKDSEGNIKTITLVISDKNAWNTEKSNNIKAFTISQLYDIGMLIGNQISKEDGLELEEMNLTTPDPAYDVELASQELHSNSPMPKVLLAIEETH